jgi:hypothetical protein
MGVRMTFDRYLDLAIRATGGLLLITCAWSLFSLLKQRASDVFGAVRDRVTGNGRASGAANEAGKMNEAVGRTADQSRAVGAARHVIALAADRSKLNPEHLLFYDFVTGAARAVIGDPGFAETVGKQMRPSVWQEPSDVASSQRGPSGLRRDAAWVDLRSAVLVCATVLVIGLSFRWWAAIH